VGSRQGAKILLLKRLAFRWALGQGFRVAAIDLPLPQQKIRVDVAACRPEPPRRVRGKTVFKPGATVVFECKTSRAEFLKETRCEDAIQIRIEELQAQRLVYEESLRRNFPTLREGETLFPEYDVFKYRDLGLEPYNLLMDELDELTRKVRANGKFAKLMRWRAASLHYLVVEPGVASVVELPPGWGLLERGEGALGLLVRAEWKESTDLNRWNFMNRIALAATAGLDRRLDGGW
jgi:hypothetical protein